MVKKSKYYYDYTRNMADEKKLVDCNCNRVLKTCICLMSENFENRSDVSSPDQEMSKLDFEAYCESLKRLEVDNCNLDNPEDCENCGS